MANIGHLLNIAQQQFAAAGISTPRFDARLLLAHVLKVPHEHLLAYPEQEVDADQERTFEAIVKRRLAFEPVSRIIGQREFWGLTFKLSTGTLDPRPDSEILVEAVLKTIDDKNYAGEFLDLGTGTGCLLLALLHELPRATGLGIDSSAIAIKTAEENAEALELTKRVQFIRQDWCDDLEGQYDWIISNPPYIPSKDIEALAPDVKLYDPIQALDGGKDGLQCYKFFAQHLKTLLKEDGKIALEIGAGQAPAVEKLFTTAGFKCLGWKMDLAGHARCGIFQSQ